MSQVRMNSGINSKEHNSDGVKYCLDQRPVNTGKDETQEENIDQPQQRWNTNTEWCSSESGLVFCLPRAFKWCPNERQQDEEINQQHDENNEQQEHREDMESQCQQDPSLNQPASDGFSNEQNIDTEKTFDCVEEAMNKGDGYDTASLSERTEVSSHIPSSSKFSTRQMVSDFNVTLPSKFKSDPNISNMHSSSTNHTASSATSASLGVNRNQIKPRSIPLPSLTSVNNHAVGFRSSIPPQMTVKDHYYYTSKDNEFMSYIYPSTNPAYWNYPPTCILQGSDPAQPIVAADVNNMHRESGRRNDIHNVPYRL